MADMFFVYFLISFELYGKRKKISFGSGLSSLQRTASTTAGSVFSKEQIISLKIAKLFIPFSFSISVTNCLIR